MIAGTHPRAAAIGAIVEEADYHERLLDCTRLARGSASIPAAPARQRCARLEP